MFFAMLIYFETRSEISKNLPSCLFISVTGLLQTAPADEVKNADAAHKTALQQVRCWGVVTYALCHCQDQNKMNMFLFMPRTRDALVTRYIFIYLYTYIYSID